MVLESPERRRQAAYLGAIALIVAVRFIGLDFYPLITADEGGWPLSVRNWVEAGTRSSDYYMAPGYHWLLGIPFQLFGALHSVARPVSAVISLLTLFLFHRLTLRLGGRELAFWATLLLGTCYPAVLTDRRALMEPFQIALMMGLCLAASSASWLIVAALAAALLLTKASAAFLLPALVISTLWPWHSGAEAWKRRFAMAGALAAGAAIAAGVFWVLYAGDPAGFLKGWARDMSATNLPGTGPRPSGGRFAFHPLSVELTLRWFGEHEPILFGLSALGLLKAIWSRQHTIMAAWYSLGAVFLFIQLYVQENHRAALLPPLCFFAAYLLCGLGRFAWVRSALALLVLYSVARIGGGIILASNPDANTLAWVAARTDANSRIMAAPYLLMQLRSQPVPFWNLGIPFVPTGEALRRTRPDWLIVDSNEWRNHHAVHQGREALDAALAQCCEAMHSTPTVTVYRVKDHVASSARF